MMSSRTDQQKELRRVTKPSLKELVVYIESRIEFNRDRMEKGSRDEFEVTKGRTQELRHILSDIKGILDDKA